MVEVRWRCVLRSGPGLCAAATLFWSATCAGLGGAGGAAAEPRMPPPPAGWRPALALEMTIPPFAPPGPWPPTRLGPGLAWVRGGRAVAVPSSVGLGVWWVAGRAAGRPTLLPYRLAGVSQYTPLSPVGVIQRKRSFGVALFVKGTNGANPRLLVDWYTRKRLRRTRFYRIHLRRVRNSGVRVAAPAGGGWFATVPVNALPGVPIRVWDDRSGRAVPVRLPPLGRRHNSAFCGGPRGELAWVGSGDGVRIATLGKSPMGRAVVRRVVVGCGPLRLGALSPNGKRLLLLTERLDKKPPYGVGRVAVVMAPGSGLGMGEVIRYLRPGGLTAARPIGLTAAPAFSPKGRLAAFAVFGVFSPHWREAGVDLFVLRVRGFRVMRWTQIPAAIPSALSFSPGGRRLALVADRRIFVFNISTGQRGSSMQGLPLSAVQTLALPPVKRGLERLGGAKRGRR